jgi:hypothetical protein
MHITLREGDGDTKFAEFTINRPVQFVQHGYPVFDTVNKNRNSKLRLLSPNAEKRHAIPDSAEPSDFL